MFKRKSSERFRRKFSFLAIGEISQTIFVIFLILYLLLLIMENTVHGFISSTFNPDYLLLVIIISGILNIFIPGDDESIERERKPGLGDYVLIVVLSIGGAALVYYKTKELGDISWILSIFTQLIILVLGFVLLWPDKHITKD